VEGDCADTKDVDVGVPGRISVTSEREVHARSGTQG
jgi:hypothetical protein